MTTITDIAVTLVLVGVVLAGIYTFMGDVFTEAQVDSIKTNFTGVQTTVDDMIDTSKDIKKSTDNIEPTESKTGFLGTTINALAISARAVASSLRTISNMITSVFTVFKIPTGDDSTIYAGILAVMTIIIVFTILRAVKGDTG